MTAYPAPTALDADAAALTGHADTCSTALGRELTAYVAGADDVRQLDEWLSHPTGPAGWAAAERLAAAAAVVQLFAAVNRLGQAAGWLRDVGAAGVDGQSPARLLREGTDGQPGAVLRAARRFVGIDGR